MDVDLGQLKEPCACGEEHSFDVDEIHIEEGAVTRLMDILENYQNPVFICDSNTRAAAEPFLEEEFKDYPIIELNPEKLRADNRGVGKVMKQLDYCDRGLSSVSVDILVAIGSGTIHDLTRYAATEYDIPFVSIPTAASGDGFTANVTSLTWDGMKRTFPGVVPTWVLADTNIIAKAPQYLTAAGVADLLAKHTALLDWRVSHLLTDEPICEEICERLERAVKDVERDADELQRGDHDAVEKLMYALILSGISMQMVKETRPVSGAEHMLAHFWDMKAINTKLDAIHGEKVGVALVRVIRLYKRLGHDIRHNHITVKSETAKGMEMGLLERVFPEQDVLEAVLAENDPNPLEDIDLELLEEKLPEIEDLIRDLPDEEQITRRLREAGCKTTPEEIGLTEEQMQTSIQVAPYVRKRLTLLRLMKLLKSDKEY